MGIENPEYQNLLIEQHLREKRIYALNNSTATVLISKLKYQLHDYECYLGKEIKNTEKKGVVSKNENYHKELDVVKNLKTIINSKSEGSQERLVKIDRELVLSFSELDSQKQSKRSCLGFIKKLIHLFKTEKSLNTLEKTINKKIGNSNDFRQKLKELKKDSSQPKENNEDNASFKI